MKTLSAGVLSEIGSTSYIAAELVEFGLSTPLFFTTAQFDVAASTATSGGSQTYLAQGNFMSFSSLTETEEPAHLSMWLWVTFIYIALFAYTKFGSTRPQWPQLQILC